jgi:hypothetical protein
LIGKSWKSVLKADPVDWLLKRENPANGSLFTLSKS